MKKTLTLSILLGFLSYGTCMAQAEAVGIEKHLPKVTKAEMFLAQNSVEAPQQLQPDPRSGLKPSVGVCLEKNINGNLLP
jgi:hypothetical protein